MPARQFIHQPEAGVVTRARVIGPGISETHDELENAARHKCPETIMVDAPSFMEGAAISVVAVRPGK
jgi:hypothetical protein